MKAINLSDIYINGDLYNRVKMSFLRHEDDSLYSAKKVFKTEEYDWPGDNEGRVLLAQVMLAQAYHKESKHLKSIMEALPGKLNSKGYFGAVLDGYFDEQQMAGNSWFLRALIEYYHWKQESSTLEMIKKLVNNLIIPLIGNMDSYPTNPKCRELVGEASGTLYAQATQGWYLSTDIGCIFIMLDGASHAYELLRDKRLKVLLDEIIEKFFSIDIRGLYFQTHATLSALRGVLRYYIITGDEKLLSKTEEIFNMYIQEAMTENYSNYNWFGRPLWTEPCAIIDSFITAVELWKGTSNSKYLELAHNILLNAIEHGQRPNGGFGCDVCSGAEHEFLYALKDVFEATWCCTMRGGDGLSRAIEYSYFVDEDTIYVPFYNNSISKLCFFDGEIILNQCTSYPYEGEVNIEVMYSSLNEEKIMKFYIPSYSKNCSVSVNGKSWDWEEDNSFIVVKAKLKTHDIIKFKFEVLLSFTDTINNNSIKDHISIRHGSLVLGVANAGEIIKLDKHSSLVYQGLGKYKLSDSDIILAPVNDLIYVEEKIAKERKLQILF